jgi:UDP-glucose 4-epimerase
VDLNHTFEHLKKMTAYKGKVKYAAEREGDIKHSLADITLATKALGYRPTIDFEEGLHRTVEWYRGQSKAAGA